MAWEARLGLKPLLCYMFMGIIGRLNGLGSPFGIETCSLLVVYQKMSRG